MSFLNTKTDLTGSMYTNEALPIAQKCIVEIFNKADPNWIKNPSGILSTYWKADDLYSICFVMRLGAYIARLNKKITSISVDKVFKKVHELINCENEKQFKELLFEFEVASEIIDRVSPLNFEPLATINIEKPGLFIPSPDLGFLVDNEEVLLEITCPRVEKIKQWEKQCAEFEKYFQTYCKKNNLNTSLEYEVPLTFNFEPFIKEHFKILSEKINDCLVGEFEFFIDQKKGSMKWESIKTFSRDELKGLASMPRFYFIQDPPNLIESEIIPHKITSYNGLHRKLAEDDLNELVIKSFRNTLKTKKEQLNNKETPYILAIKISKNDIFCHNNHEWIKNRIFENQQYNWINGISLFESETHNTDFKNLIPRLHIIVINKNAKNKCDGIEALFSWNH